MSLAYEVRKPNDLSKINSNDMGELLWWSYILGVTVEKLLSATEKVGNSITLIRQEL